MIILSPNLVALVVFESFKKILMLDYKHWNSGNDVAVFRARNVLEHGISLKDYNIKAFKALAISLI